MKRFRQYLYEAKLGDCFQAAGRFMMDLDDKLENEVKMIHAIVRGEGELEGRRFGHAFNKIGDVIFDNSNGDKVVMRKEQYYKQGGIDPKEKGAYIEYDKTQTMVKMLKNKHWGPWDLNMSLEEELPDEKKEIGKKKLKISPKMLQIAKDKRFE